KRRPIPRGLARAAVDHQVFGALGHLRVQVVTQHPECCLLRPPTRGAHRATRCPDRLSHTEPPPEPTLRYGAGVGAILRGGWRWALDTFTRGERQIVSESVQRSRADEAEAALAPARGWFLGVGRSSRASGWRA